MSTAPTSSSTDVLDAPGDTPAPAEPATPTEQAADPASPDAPSQATATPRGRRARVSLNKEGSALAEPTSADPAPDAHPSRIRSLLAVPTTTRALAAWGAVAAVLLLVAVVAGVSWYLQEYTGPATNRALVDVGDSAQAAQQIDADITTIYSFDYARLAENERNARAVITPDFQQQFDQIFADVRARAPQQKAVVTATVASSAVRELHGDTAVVVIFLDQLATRAADNGQPQQLASAGRLIVTGKLVDGHWKVADVKAV